MNHVHVSSEARSFIASYVGSYDDRAEDLGIKTGGVNIVVPHTLWSI